MCKTTEATRITQELCAGQLSGADRLMEIVYEEMRRLARHYLSQEAPQHTLQPTALVHEAFLKLVNQREVDWQGRSHFLAVGAQAMRRILVDHARTKNRQKRGGEYHRVPLTDTETLSTTDPDDVLSLDAALDKLATESPLQARIVELRFFGGMTMDEIATVLAISKRSVERHWTMVRAWLRRELAEEQDA